MNQNTLRRKIIEVAAGCFLKYGIKNTSMNFMSEILHISKRTLYQSFPSKRNLLKVCVTFRLEANRTPFLPIWQVSALTREENN